MELSENFRALFSGDANHTMMPDFWNLSTYNYDLPSELIAQNPIEPRDCSRLLTLNRQTGECAHHHFFDLPDFLREGDLLVLNDTRVFPARIFGHKIPSGRKVEILCLAPDPDISNTWHALVKPGKKLPPGCMVRLSDGSDVTICEYLPDGVRRVHFPKGKNALALLSKLGEMPLPPYIKNSTAPAERYQTIYSDPDKTGSAAAPTAGLHFTEPLFDRLSEKEVGVEYITLNVGLGTFRPVKVADIREHTLHSEICEIGEETAQRIMKTKKSGRRIIAVGTTVVRTLESFAREDGFLQNGLVSTNIFIHPGYSFKMIDGMVTNFHLPQSTLLMLVTAFGGYAPVMEAYKKAVEERYRFFSFGDAMLIL